MKKKKHTYLIAGGLILVWSGIEEYLNEALSPFVIAAIGVVLILISLFTEKN